ncbi:PC4/YdbC family ssDNA-binding protein [Clostridium sp. SHJSY1]|uniref:YdbC family protein n=1 Tax=Clostridium sp. SHJSY1 TaxID=2942483 RepID=UPI0028740069|nr:PC4/YdbC family ssDNA-binding protein [Clostridium sp. SHJSY1]MDS0526196.1 PC4/YdbC family ssDNA-binding protein [Clostridium sp. SHJSY1]
MAEIKFQIIKNLGVLSEGAKGWKKEVNLISWNNRKPKIDIREWDENHEKMGKGVTISKEEFNKFNDILKNLNMEELEVD